jgi:hypothetical protein
MRGDLRETDKEERKGIGGGSHFCIGNFCKRWRRRRKMGRIDYFGNSHRALLLLGIFGSGDTKPQGFLELGSERGCS